MKPHMIHTSFAMASRQYPRNGYSQFWTLLYDSSWTRKISKWDHVINSFTMLSILPSFVFLQNHENTITSHRNFRSIIFPSTEGVRATPPPLQQILFSPPNIYIHTYIPVSAWKISSGISTGDRFAYLTRLKPLLFVFQGLNNDTLAKNLCSSFKEDPWFIIHYYHLVLALWSKFGTKDTKRSELRKSTSQQNYIGYY